MQPITVQPLLHNGNIVIGIFYAHSAPLNNIIKKVTGIKWTHTHTCWYLPCTKIAYTTLVEATKDVATINNTQLNTYLQQQKATQPTATLLPIVTMPQVGKAVLLKIYSENSHVLPKLQQYLQLKAYSKSTIKTYMNEVAQLLYLIKATPADTLGIQRIKDYLQYCYTELGLSENTLHSRMNALKFYYEQVLGKERFFWQVPRPKKPIQLPKFFNAIDIANIINATTNLKHKVMLMLTYSAGLRVSEVVAIKTYHVNSQRMCILIERAKGKKDRIVGLSPLLLIMLREYWKQYQPTAKGYLFEGQDKKEAYSTRSLQTVLNDAKQKAGIIKPGGIHSLRHSFATHLLDGGTDISLIQKLLGHNDIKTTLRYLHTSNRDMLQIISPLDYLKLDTTVQKKLK